MRQMAGRLASATGSPLKGNFTRQGTATTGHDRFHAHKVSSPWETLIGRGQIDRSIKANRKLNRSNSTLEFLAFTFFRRERYIYIYISNVFVPNMRSKFPRRNYRDEGRNGIHQESRGGLATRERKRNRCPSIITVPRSAPRREKVSFNRLITSY